MNFANNAAGLDTVNVEAQQTKAPTKAVSLDPILSRPWPLWKRDEQRRCRAAYVREFYRRRNRGTVFSRNPESACDPDRRAIARVLWSQGFDAALIAEVAGISERRGA